LFQFHAYSHESEQEKREIKRNEITHTTNQTNSLKQQDDRNICKHKEAATENFIPLR
jgi:hypothetical protein